ncbi:MAG: ZIP family metal transporter, partial [Candidatus Omnitrophica bacterium]|nr:ZIP family metal transporter [Candidatus Omnitrophota bacterium]
VYGGFTRKKALFFNFISALTAVLGALTGYFVADIIHGFTSFVMPLAAGGFIYIATSDLIPEIHKESNQKKATLAFVAFLSGIIFMGLVKYLFHS